MALVYYARDPHSGSIGIGASQTPPAGYVWVEESTEPHGDWYSVFRYLECRDAVRTYRHLITGERVQRVIKRYDSRPSALAPEGHDICVYCGTDNGPNGELRYGFDCACCGGN